MLQGKWKKAVDEITTVCEGWGKLKHDTELEACAVQRKAGPSLVEI